MEQKEVERSQTALSEAPGPDSALPPRIKPESALTHPAPMSESHPPTDGGDTSWRGRYRWWAIRWRAWLGYRIYGGMGPRTVRIGPRTVLKWGTRVDMDEADAMRFVAANTSVPVPEVFAAWKHGNVTVIKMRYIKGIAAWGAWNKLSAAQRATVASQLEDYIKQLRSLTPPSPSSVSSTHGGPMRDHRVGMYTVGPFETHDDFHRFLRTGNDLENYEEASPELVALHSCSYVSKYTHGDLALWNVKVHKGRISAIIDWDSAGWRPEYWEYAKVKFNPLGVPDEWFAAVRKATGTSDEEVKGERYLWLRHEFPGQPVYLAPIQKSEDQTE